jgi:hypothetical protein
MKCHGDHERPWTNHPHRNRVQKLALVEPMEVVDDAPMEERDDRQPAAKHEGARFGAYSFVDANTATAVGGSGLILHTTDGGTLGRSNPSAQAVLWLRSRSWIPTSESLWALRELFSARPLAVGDRRGFWRSRQSC